MNSIGTLVGVRFVGAQKPLVHALGLNAAVFLNECLYWQSKVGIGNWFARTIPQFTDDTGLSKSEQATVRDKLLSIGLIREQKGVQYRTQTQVDIEVFNDFLTAIQPQETVQLADQKVSAESTPAAENLSASRSKPVGSYNREEQKNSKELEGNDESALHSGKPGVNPYQVWEAYCKGRGLVVNHLVGNQLQRQLHTAKLILGDGISVDDVECCAHWLQSQEWWRSKGFTLNDVRNQYPRWAGLNKPYTEKAMGTKQIRGTTPSL